MPPATLRLLSWNIQCGIETKNTRDYLTRGWRHLLPHRGSPGNLRRIAGLLTHFDLVALQEVDGGSLRSGFLNQVEYLADMAGFPFWHAQRTRNLAQFGQHGNGLLARYALNSVIEHRLPGFIPGRGALEAHIGEGEQALVVVVMHLALSRRARRAQLLYLSQHLQAHRHLVIVGDMNADADEVRNVFAAGGIALQALQLAEPTFPSWQPTRCIDHFFVSPELRVQALEVLPYSYSDHLPVALQIDVPTDVRLSAPGHRAPLVPALKAQRIARP